MSLNRCRSCCWPVLLRSAERPEAGSFTAAASGAAAPALTDTGRHAAAGARVPAAADAGSARPADTKTLPQGYLYLLRGTLNPDSPLALLRGNEHMWRIIFTMVDEAYERHIDRESKAYSMVHRRAMNADYVEFPAPQDININMMPIKLGDEDSVPGFCRPYLDLINACTTCLSRSHLGGVAYLTIQEGWVPVGQAQRRPGLHIESPTAMIANGGQLTECKVRALRWGDGYLSGRRICEGGIFMASNVANSTKVWPVLIKDSADVTDEHGGIENMRERLGPGRVLAANELCWFTDRTPHESLPLQAPESDPQATKVYRQFFRLVVGKISVWYSKHNTPNPNGLQPEVEISDRDKFASLSATGAASALGALSLHEGCAPPGSSRS